MKRILLLLIVLAGGVYYANQAGMVPGWPRAPLPEWVPAWARVGHDATTAGAGQEGQGGRQGARQARSGGQGRFGQGADEGPVPVVAAASRYEDVPVTADAVGTVKALNTVTVRPQVDGKLIKIAFKEGQDVNKGFVLAEIDPDHLPGAIRPGGGQEGAGRGAARQCPHRSRPLHQAARRPTRCRSSSPTPRRRWSPSSRRRPNRDQAAIDNAKAMLDYTDDRRADRRPHRHPPGRRGNIVHATDTTGIVVITQIKPIAVLFNLPQQDLPDWSTAAWPRARCAVQALGADNTHRGRPRQGRGDQQSGRSDHRHGAAQGRVSQ